MRKSNFSIPPCLMANGNAMNDRDRKINAMMEFANQQLEENERKIRERYLEVERGQSLHTYGACLDIGPSEWTPGPVNPTGIKVEFAPISLTPGYHLTNIPRGEMGEASKIKEEMDEFMDSILQDASIMALVELADMIGAITAYLAKHHPSITIDDLIKMQSITERAFKNGYRR